VLCWSELEDGEVVTAGATTRAENETGQPMCAIPTTGAKAQTKRRVDVNTPPCRQNKSQRGGYPTKHLSIGTTSFSI
jgi:hypothetical protein